MVGPSTQKILRNAQFENQRWHDIRVKAASDPELKRLLDQAEIYYILRWDSDEYSTEKVVQK